MTDETIERQALFAGLVFNEKGEPADVRYVGGVAHYAIPDNGFLRHVQAAAVDSAVLAMIQEQITSMQDEVVRGMLAMIGKNDIFAKAAIDASIRNLECNVRRSDPNQWLPWLRLLGFRIVVNVHGEVVQLMYPEQPGYGDDE